MEKFYETPKPDLFMESVQTAFALPREKLERILSILQSELEQLDVGELQVVRQEGRTYFREYRAGRSEGITTDVERLYRNARAAYVRLKLAILELALEGKQNPKLQKRLQKKLEGFDLANLNMDKVLLSPAEAEWKLRPQTRKAERQEQLRFTTPGGVRVRTKSELMIGTVLEKYHIPYRYEPELVIGGVLYHPDFVVLMPDHHFIIIEHCGRMDSPGYVDALVRRLEAFEKADLYLGEAVWMSLEHDTVSEAAAVKMIQRCMQMEGIPYNDLCRYLTKANWVE